VTVDGRSVHDRHAHDRLVNDRALEGARLASYPVGEFIGQESFMSAGEVLALALQAGIAPGVSVLDLCCGVAGPGRFLTSELGCSYLGVDADASAVDIARERAGPGCRFEVATVPPVPDGRFDVVLLLETVLAFPDKDGLLREVASALTTGGRFAFTVEVGQPLNETERAAMPHADTVWLVPLQQLLSCLGRAGFAVRWQRDCTRAHQATVDALIDAFVADAAAIQTQLGAWALDELLAAHILWSDWLRSGRARKLAVVAEKLPTS
jgi:SAM-dependent methyltransferase